MCPSACDYSLYVFGCLLCNCFFFIVEVRSESKKAAANESNEEEKQLEKFDSTANRYSEDASMISSIIKA
jgi:ribosomal protein S26